MGRHGGMTFQEVCVCVAVSSSRVLVYLGLQLDLRPSGRAVLPVSLRVFEKSSLNAAARETFPLFQEVPGITAGMPR